MQKIKIQTDANGAIESRPNNRSLLEAFDSDFLGQHRALYGGVHALLAKSECVIARSGLALLEAKESCVPVGTIMSLIAASGCDHAKDAHELLKIAHPKVSV